ncbi:protein kinase [Nocardia cyriacigeorgica]|uniref:serine/threonine-protein kinase n=1 Tax=Nocardia cyriacigeorgica TaxID=135487 RepID=UPI0018961D45|nr:serine/threonine-protein kinase [Nocardia cyriacigeorgica]MBF6347103.1 protein kinase [Nocardia cyriacigeorgica]MBF6396395.1 protein kinase [Nocardia cyriacigeorgica]MBF6402027.1 protein kinase [Nocardia cyriacigeorgica]
MTADRLIAGRYRLTDPIGTGAMGVVWRATDVRLRRTVAVKQVLLGPGLTREAALEAKLRAKREGRIAARLHHPNAITVFDVVEEDEQPWLVMEYMDAPSLAAKLAGGRTLPAMEVAEIGAQAAAALAAAHDAGIVHRDVKPANLLVADDGTVKITDFGISRAVGDVTVTATGFLAGTPAYLAPEVARGENPEPASDVFALGSTLYAAVEGAPPFGEGDNPLAVLHAVARAQVRPPEKAGDLGPVLMRLLAATVEERPTMKEARRALEDVAAGRAPRVAVPAATKVLPHPSSGPEPVGSSAATQAVPRPVAGPTPGPMPARPVAAAAPGTVPGGPVPPSSSSGRGRMIALIAAASAGVLVLVALVAAAVNGGGEPSAGGQGTSSVTAAQPSVDAVAPEGSDRGESGDDTTTAPTTTTTTTSATPTSTTSTTSTPAGPPTPERVVQFVSGYYGMLPGNAAAAWSQLSPAYQAQTGYSDYLNFWSGISAVTVHSVTPNGDTGATVSLTYTLKDGSTSTESRWIQVASDNGRLLIANSGL